MFAPSMNVELLKKNKTKKTHKPRCYHWYIIGLSKIRWTGIGEKSTEDGHQIWFSGEEKQYRYGGDIYCQERYFRVSSGVLPSPAETSPSIYQPNCTTWPTSRFMLQHQTTMTRKFYEFMDIHEKNIIVQGDWYTKVGPGYTRTGQECLGNLASGSPTTRASDNLNLPEATTSPWQTPYTPISCLEPQPDTHLTSKSTTRLTSFWFSKDSSPASTRQKTKNISRCRHQQWSCSCNDNLQAKVENLLLFCILFDLKNQKDPEVADVYQAYVGSKFAALLIVR